MIMRGSDKEPMGMIQLMSWDNEMRDNTNAGLEYNVTDTQVHGGEWNGEAGLNAEVIRDYRKGESKYKKSRDTIARVK